MARRYMGRLLRPRRERPSGHHAAEQHDELAPLHSITSSARMEVEAIADRLRGFHRGLKETGYVIPLYRQRR